ncbi:MAG: 50S ribosomal protein L30 [Archangiaceae bacterium]|nr:50S ribosomal protein L30 [Archangiaceae bacterium]
MGIKVTLWKSHSGSNERQVATLVGLGLKKLGDIKVLKDTPAIRGMVFKVKHLIHVETVKEDPKPRKRLKPRKIRLRDAARAKAEKKS